MSEESDIPSADKVSTLTEAQKKKLLKALWAREVARSAESFEYFLFRHVRTKDEHDATNPLKQVPNKEYLRLLSQEFQNGPDIIYVAKSRQLMVSWLLAAFGVWKALYQPFARVCFQSKKLEDAAQMVFDTSPLVARASFIMANLDPNMQVCLAQRDGKRVAVPFTLDQKVFSYGNIKLPNGSLFEALAQGAAQVEGKVPTLFISDESSLQDEWRSSWAAMRPCISNGGRAIAVATMRMPSAFGDEIAPCDSVDPDSLMRGVARFSTASGGYGLRVHYSADPDKDPKTERGALWFSKEVAGMVGGFDGSDWQQHMEINPESLSGELVFKYWPQIRDTVVVDDVPYEACGRWRLGGGADYGMRNPTVILYCGIDYAGDIYILDEQAAPGQDVGGIVGLSAIFKKHPLFYRVNGTVQMDPTAWAATQNQAKGGVVSPASMFGTNGVTFQPAKLRGQEADDVTIARLHELWGGYEDPDWRPGLYICRRCTGLLDAIPRLRYQDWSPGLQGDNDLKKKMRGGLGLDFWDALKHWIVSQPVSAGGSMAKPPPPPMSFAGLRNSVMRRQREIQRARS